MENISIIKLMQQYNSLSDHLLLKIIFFITEGLFMGVNLYGAIIYGISVIPTVVFSETLLSLQTLLVYASFYLGNNTFLSNIVAIPCSLMALLYDVYDIIYLLSTFPYIYYYDVFCMLVVFMG